MGCDGFGETTWPRVHHQCLYSPGPGEDAMCTDSNPTRRLLFRLKAHTQSDLCRKCIAWLVNPPRCKRTKWSSNALTAFPFLSNPMTLSYLKIELPNYLARASDGCVDTDHGVVGQAGTIPTSLDSCSLKIVLVQPLSAVAASIFSLWKMSFNECQDHALQDYLEALLMLQYNKRRHCAQFTCMFQ